MRIKIVSGTDTVRLRSEENHRHYASRHGYDYSFDTTVYTDLHSPHFRKLHSVLNVLDGSDWVFWLDDDAYFSAMSERLEQFLEGVPEDIFLVICASPVNPQGGWTFLSSGQFFIKNTPRSRNFLRQVLATPIETARDWWDASRYGMFTNGDQDSFVYILATEGLLENTKLLPYQAFNARPYHYKNRIDEYFIVHFPGVPDKNVAVAEFGARFGLDDTLVFAGETSPSKSLPLDADAAADSQLRQRDPVPEEGRLAARKPFSLSKAIKGLFAHFGR